LIQASLLSRIHSVRTLPRPSVPAREGPRQKYGLSRTYEAIMGESDEGAGVSRRTVLIAAAGAVPALALMINAAEAKIAPAAVNQADPKDGKQCDACNFFVAPNACKQVDGDIAPTGWCLLWVKKPA
jgi:hypothetical protein